ncbi:RnfABCDGE type electron transport complex subunit D [Ferroacidibacillus organovorans]|uniref:RnfABCDGE type electron transport complex subunit D n=1 Tax=Ferroacidibacillus organovorans TaxID=1765683 RepID=A0A101XR77_9BACL|nr:RnfABCDGE type electron transport complex subunit D [Ferroacidibacillus organovorans]KUO96045.1 hypothetical protein ATW55_01355 [Ferroacidibacillus organovorans]
MSEKERVKRAPQPSFERFIKTPKGTVMAMLIGLTMIAALRPQDHFGLVNALVAALTGVVVDGAVALLLKRGKLFSDGGIITGLIVADVLSQKTPLLWIVAITAIALLSKHILKLGRKPLFNPAAFGLLIATFIVQSGQSWWGSLALMPTWLTFVVIIAGVFLTVRVNKFPQVAAYLGTYFGLLFLMAIFHLGLPTDTPADALRVPFVNTALFLAFFMVTDPPTSPAAYGQQVVFGFVTAVVSTIIFATVGGLAYPLIGLLVANGWKALWSLRSSRQKDSDRTKGRTYSPQASNS